MILCQVVNLSSTLDANSALSTSALDQHPGDINVIESEVGQNKYEAENSKLITESETQDTPIIFINSDTMPFSNTVDANNNLSTSAFGHHPEDINFIASEAENNETESEIAK